MAAAYTASLKGKFKILMWAKDSQVLAQYTLILDNRDVVQAKLKEFGVPSVIYYPKALTQQEGYSSFRVVSSGVEVSERLTSQSKSADASLLIDRRFRLNYCEGA